MIEPVIASFSYITLAAHVAIIILILSFLSDTLFKTSHVKSIKKFISPYGLQLAFFVALLATLGSLFLSEIAHFQPCILCWYQRIAMYPQALILYMAMLRSDLNVRRYMIALSSIGLIVALYHYFIQLVPQGAVMPCAAVGGVSCIEGYQFYFGYMSFPLMSATAFLGIIILLLFTPGDSRGLIADSHRSAKIRH